jgi:hypothetical protein
VGEIAQVLRDKFPGCTILVPPSLDNLRIGAIKARAADLAMAGLALSVASETQGDLRSSRPRRSSSRTPVTPVLFRVPMWRPFDLSGFLGGLSADESAKLLEEVRKRSNEPSRCWRRVLAATARPVDFAFLPGFPVVVTGKGDRCGGSRRIVSALTSKRPGTQPKNAPRIESGRCIAPPIPVETAATSDSPVAAALLPRIVCEDGQSHGRAWRRE